MLAAHGIIRNLVALHRAPYPDLSFLAFLGKKKARKTAQKSEDFFSMLNP